MKAVITRFFRSVAGKVFCVLTVCILALLLINWLLNTFAFAKLYEREKETLLTSASPTPTTQLHSGQTCQALCLCIAPSTICPS